MEFNKDQLHTIITLLAVVLDDSYNHNIVKLKNKAFEFEMNQDPVTMVKSIENAWTLISEIDKYIGNK